MPKRSSNVVSRLFGRGIRAVIARTELTYRELAKRLGWQEAKISDLTTGKGGVDEVELRELLAYCHATVAERERLVALYLEAKEVGWLQVPEDGLPDQVQALIELEQEADEIIEWSMVLIPGLLQIPDYSHVVTQHSPVIKAADVPAVATERSERARILVPGRKFVFYIHEQALLLPVGGLEVWREQLAHLMRVSVRKYVSIRIIPTSVGIHAGTAGDFRVMRFPKYSPVVYNESVNYCLFFDDPGTVKIHEDILTALAKVALSEEDSRAVIDSILEGLQ